MRYYHVALLLLIGMAVALLWSCAEGHNKDRIVVYYGSDSGITGVSWIETGDQDDAWFGVSVASAGDVNGDGFSDVVIGASHYDDGETDEGRAYLYYGSATGLADTPAWHTDGNQDGAQLGRSVSIAGDVNGDGFSDLIIGAYLYEVLVTSPDSAHR